MLRQRFGTVFIARGNGIIALAFRRLREGSRAVVIGSNDDCDVREYRLRV